MNEAIRLSFDPLAPTVVVLALLVAGAAAFLVYLIGGGRAPLWRFLLGGLFIAALANPLWIREQRDPLPDIIAVILDRSESMELGERQQIAEEIRNTLAAQLEADDSLETRWAQTPANAGATEIHAALRAALSDAPRERIAGAILITDGQIHDTPDDASTVAGPVHALIAGRSQVPDRRVAILAAPDFGFVGQAARITLVAHGSGEDQLTVTITVNGVPTATYVLLSGQPRLIDVVLPHRGANLVVAEVARRTDELTITNNSALADITGVRDRLRVLLVTGYPHAGGRVWRDLLKSDPSVDLVHFTILRPPFKNDATPTRELALIPFPTRELFVDRLAEFDLIILDQYQRRNVLPMAYFDNIARYVADGGALLTTSGRAFAGPASIYRTSLASILPGRPTGQIIEEKISLKRSDTGERHTITASLPDDAEWGPWQRHVVAESVSGDTLITTAQGTPILLVDRVGKGRVAALMSDQMWLWARKHEGGGPYGELIRRTAHWLMREPELEEERLKLTTEGGKIKAELRSLKDAPAPLSLSDPEGRSQTLQWTEKGPGIFQTVTPDQVPIGLHQGRMGDLSALVLNGPANPREYADIQVTDAILRPWIADNGGGIFFVTGSDDMPQVRRVGKNARTTGRNWMGLKRNNAYRVVALESTSLMPGLIGVALALALMMLAWRAEGR